MPKHRNKEGFDSPDCRETSAPEGAPPCDEPTSKGDEVAALKERLEHVTAELAQTKDQLLRALADMQNQRKRFAAEREQLQRLATQQLLKDLLPVLDNFERTLAAAEAGASRESLVQGVASVDRLLRAVLEGRSLGRIEAEGKPFDPNLHEAVETHETLELPEGTVVRELEAGYKLADVVLRPARVKVSKRP